jgi:hypothetical protein
MPRVVLRTLPLPADHQPAMHVPQGGSMCANCKFYDPTATRNAQYGQCREVNYQAFYGTTAIPCPPDQFCSDWYMPDERLRAC